MSHLSIRDVARRLFSHPSTIRKLVADGTIPEPLPLRERGWNSDQLPAIKQAVDDHMAAARAARLAAFEKARAVRTANLEARRAEKETAPAT